MFSDKDTIKKKWYVNKTDFIMLYIYICKITDRKE